MNQNLTASRSSATNGSLAELQKRLQEFETAMLVTRTDEGHLRARPMAIQKPSPELHCDLWFVASFDSAKMEEIERQPHVCVTCLRGKGSAYISISAHAHVHRDRALVKKLFQPEWKVWWPKGPDDPTIAFIEMQVERAEDRQEESSPVHLLYEMAKGLVKGESADRPQPAPKRI